MAIVHAEPATTVTYVLDADAQIAAARAQLWRYIRLRRAWIRLAIGLVAVAALGAGIGILLEEDPLWWMLGFVAELIVLVPVLYLVLFLVLPRRVRRLASQSAIWTRPLTVTWSPAGLSAKAANGTTELRWAEYHGWHAAKCGFLFYFNEQQYQVVPATALAPVHAEALRAILEQSDARRL